jgi:hypothetical protein
MKIVRSALCPHPCNYFHVQRCKNWFKFHAIVTEYTIGSIGIVIFDAAAPSLVVALSQAGEERLLWEMAGARGVSSLMVPLE